jgi:fluoride exporter
MKLVLLVFLGGGLGSVARYTLGKWINVWHAHHFPLATLIINVAACLILGFVIGLADHKQIISPAMRVFWAIGFCGGFSTFSSFSNETIGLLQNGFTISLLVYTLSSLVLCGAAIVGGIYLGRV